MKKLFEFVFVLQLCIISGAALCAGTAKPVPPKPKPTLAVQEIQPTMEGVLQLADKYAGLCEPKLTDQDKTAVDDVKDTLSTTKREGEVFLKKAVDNLVSQLTLSLADGESLDGVTVASVCVLKESPKNRRTLNLFGSALQTRGKNKDAILVFRYALSLDANNPLTRLNLANVYLDDNQDEKAKALLDRLQVDDSGNKAVFRALATYYYRKQNWKMFKECLLKASEFGGYTQSIEDDEEEEVNASEVKDGDSTDAMEAKLKKLDEVVPLTTADVLEKQYPDAAAKIRDKYGKLADTERWILPKLPAVKLNGPQDYADNLPIVDEWIQVACGRFAVFPMRSAEAMGADPNASDKVKEAQAQAAARKQMAEAARQAQQSIKMMEKMPGISQKDIAEAKKALKELTSQENIKVEDKPVDTSAPPPGVDSGSLFAGENFHSYTIISTSYFKYLNKYFQDYDAKVADIMKVYTQKVDEENKRFKPIWDQLQEEHSKAIGDVDGPHGKNDPKCRKAMIDHKKLLNAISDNYYRQWSNLYMPQYAQKMKPTLDAFFNICMLYVRNMNDPKIMEREYGKTTNIYMTFATKAVGGLGAGNFTYYPETEEEERQLDYDIAKAKDEAQAKTEEFQQSFQSPEFSFTQWVDDHFVLQVAGEVASLKITSKSIEFEAYVPGVGGGVKYDFSEEKFETYTAVGGKLEVGINICGAEAKIEGAADAYRRTATWDLAKGTYQETTTAKAGVTGSFGPVSAGGEFQLDTQLVAKVSGQVSVFGTVAAQGEKQLN